MHNTTFSGNIFGSRENLGFLPDEYSRFKYGSKTAARKMGRELAHKFITKKSDEILKISQQIVVMPSPYDFVPTATFALKDYFIPVLNEFLTKNGKLPVQELKISRRSSYTMDYGDMSIEERKANIGSESFHIDTEFVKGKFLIFMDDIRITGSHEERIKEMIKRNKLSKYENTEWLFMYYAEMMIGKEEPNIESYLNLFSIKDCLSINKIIQNEKFLFNTRNIKFILKRPHEECKEFLQYQSKIFIDTMYHYALGNSYHKCEEFRENFLFLQNLISWQH